MILKYLPSLVFERITVNFNFLHSKAFEIDFSLALTLEKKEKFYHILIVKT